MIESSIIIIISDGKMVLLKCQDEAVPMNEINRPLICSLLINWNLILPDYQETFYKK